jgi:hypothetical protein
VIDHVVDAIRSSAAARWQSVRRLRAETRSALALRRTTRRALARGIRQQLHEQRAAVIASLRAAHASVWQLWPETSCARDVDGTDDQLQAQILRVIRKHPDGISAVDMGNQLGIDWRRVVIIARTLVDAGQVDQVGQAFYPGGKVSRT